MSKEEMTFEYAMKRIEEIVNILENGNTTLDDSISLFEEATSLCSFCNKRLEDAKNKVASFSIVNTDEVEA